ncbi:hypothetical protein FACS1894130_10550 [Spirochaetia bacterium]|nr:hypothetical protein FACS1894130_10550 [Spirochaetia bacterium]
MGHLMTVKEAAPQLLMAEITLYRLLRKGEILHHRIGKKYLFTPDDIQQYLKKCAVPATKGANE